MLSKFQQEMGSTLLDPLGKLPSGLETYTKQQAERRLAIYRNNIFGSLIDVLRSAYAVTALVVGNDFWLEMTRAFIRTHPPRETHLLTYGAELPKFIDSTSQVRLPYLGDLARLEWARIEAYHAADADGINVADLKTITPENIPNLCFSLHPSARLVDSSYPVQSIWEAHDLATGTARPITANESEKLLVLRPQGMVQIFRLTSGECVFLKEISSGECLAKAAEEALNVQPEFDLQQALLSHLTRATFANYSYI